MTAGHALHTIALAGPTASGKTAAALAIARRWPVEIISMDSALVYRGMDIGTAKPSAHERAAVPHHLIDIREPTQAYSAAEFAREAAALIAAIQARGRRPLLVGGTMLYLKALIDGLDEMPPAQPEVRAAIAHEAQALGWPVMHARLAALDPSTAARLSPNDSQRISRALEVYAATGKTLSQFHTRHGAIAEPGSTQVTPTSTLTPPSAATTRPTIGLLITLEPQDRGWLHQRIAERFDAMLAAGLLDELRLLRARGDLHAELPAMRCVGYRQAWEALDAARQPEALSPDELQRLREAALAATRQLARRQLTWLRGLPARQVVACDQPSVLERVLSLVQAVS